MEGFAEGRDVCDVRIVMRDFNDGSVADRDLAVENHVPCRTVLVRSQTFSTPTSPVGGRRRWDRGRLYTDTRKRVRRCDIDANRISGFVAAANMQLAEPLVEQQLVDWRGIGVLEIVVGPTVAEHVARKGVARRDDAPGDSMNTTRRD